MANFNKQVVDIRQHAKSLTTYASYIHAIYSHKPNFNSIHPFQAEISATKSDK